MILAILAAMLFSSPFSRGQSTPPSWSALEAAKPVASRPAGTYAAGTTVTLSDMPTNGSIYYTTDGSTPTTGSTLYTGPITINSTEAIEAIAASPSLLNSGVASATYTVATATATPVITPAPGSYPANPSISISDSTSGATIYYTTTGATPTSASAIYSGSFTVTPSAISTVTVKAIAVAPGDAASTVATATFTITTTTSQLTVSGKDPYNLACAVTGPAVTGLPGPSGTVTFTDTTTGTTVGTATLGTSVTSETFIPVAFAGDQYYDSVTATADLNGDGIPDLVVAAGTSLLVYLGNGDGTYQAGNTVNLRAMNLTVSGTLNNMALLDFNGDGKIDLAFLNDNSTELVVLWGNGDGTFQLTPQTYSLPAAASGILSGNFNGDAYGDLALSIPADSEVLVFLGNGGRVLQNAATYPAGGNIVVAGHFTGGSNTDLAVLGGGAVSVLPGNGDGTFGTPIVQSLSFGAISAVSADFNKDGKSDIAVGDDEGNVWVLLGNGDGTFQAPAARALGGDVGVTADFNGDGNLDLAWASTDLSLGNGNGTFGHPFYAAKFYGQIGPFAAVDLNGDGRVDLVYAYSVALNYPEASATGSLANATVTPDTISSHELQCSYGGDSNYAGSSSSLVNITFGPAAIPVFSLLVGNYSTAQTVRISDTTPNTTIYYTSDGSTPTTSSTVYTGPIPVTSTVTLKAIAVGPSVLPSAVSEVVYTITDPPASSFSGSAVTLTDSTTGAAIYYTIDGSTPSKTSTKYSAPFNIYGQVTVNAIALAPQHLFSTVSSATYTSGLAVSATALASSASTGDENQKITLTATVTGFNPTGTVTFLSNGQNVGTAQLSGGTATTQVSFATAGTYTITANYAGDASNEASTSGSVTLVIVAPSYTLGSDPTAKTISPGQSATFTITVTPAGGYDGTVKFSCGALPSEATCSFSPASVTPKNGAPASTTLTIATTAATSAASTVPRSPFTPWRTGGLALAGLLGLTLVPRKARKLRAGLGALLVAGLWLPLAGCGGGGGGSTGGHGNPGTPAGSYTISVAAADSSAGTQQSVQLTLTVN
ncbi:MAG: chitobiase/beta-hexosaminidase C-terminal domain-containing protein [Acidobacteriaceae bacterium]